MYRIEEVVAQAKWASRGYFYAGGVCVVEWAQYIEDELPSTFLKIRNRRRPCKEDGESERDSSGPTRKRVRRTSINWRRQQMSKNEKYICTSSKRRC